MLCRETVFRLFVFVGYRQNYWLFQFSFSRSLDKNTIFSAQVVVFCRRNVQFGFLRWPVRFCYLQTFNWRRDKGKLKVLVLNHRKQFSNWDTLKNISLRRVLKTRNKCPYLWKCFYFALNLPSCLSSPILRHDFAVAVVVAVVFCRQRRRKKTNNNQKEKMKHHRPTSSRRGARFLQLSTRAITWYCFHRVSVFHSNQKLFCALWFPAHKRFPPE